MRARHDLAADDKLVLQPRGADPRLAGLRAAGRVPACGVDLGGPASSKCREECFDMLRAVDSRHWVLGVVSDLVDLRLSTYELLEDKESM